MNLMLSLLPETAAGITGRAAYRQALREMPQLSHGREVAMGKAEVVLLSPQPAWGWGGQGVCEALDHCPSLVVCSHQNNTNQICCFIQNAIFHGATASLKEGIFFRKTLGTKGFWGTLDHMQSWTETPAFLTHVPGDMVSLSGREFSTGWVKKCLSP